jgi:glutathionylspermidine synthase
MGSMGSRGENSDYITRYLISTQPTHQLFNKFMNTEIKNELSSDIADAILNAQLGNTRWINYNPEKGYTPRAQKEFNQIKKDWKNRLIDDTEVKNGIRSISGIPNEELNYYKFPHFPFEFYIITSAPVEVMDKAVQLFKDRQEDQENVLNIEDCLKQLGFDSSITETVGKEYGFSHS